MLLIVLIRELRKPGPVLLQLMQEEHASQQAEVIQITNAHKEASAKFLKTIARSSATSWTATNVKIEMLVPLEEERASGKNAHSI